MHRFTVHLALIAYLVGGWLLPAAHHHGHDHVISDGDCACSVSECGANASPQKVHDSSHAAVLLPQSDAKEHDSACACEHSTERPVWLGKAMSDSDVDARSGDPAQCVGLCALCCATGLSDHFAAEASGKRRAGCLSNLFSDAGLAWPLSPLEGGISSRGPPQG